MSDTIDLIKEKLNELRDIDSGFEIFGSSSHEYQFNQVISEKDLIEFEQNNNCILPGEYKEFLLEIGNGGAGPSYGLFPFGYMDDGYELSKWSNDFVAPEKPFKFHDAFNDTSMFLIGAPIESDFNNSNEFEAAYDEWADNNYERLQTEYWDLHALDGAIPICHHGCAYRSWLVVAAGKEYGYVWNDDTPSQAGVFPAQTESKNRCTFAEWYSDWLVKSINEMRAKYA